MAVCATARDQPVRATAPRAAAAASQAIGLTGFMQDNSTSQAATKIPPRPSGGCGIARSAAPESGAGVSPAFPRSGDHRRSFLFASSRLRCSPLPWPQPASWPPSSRLPVFAVPPFRPPSTNKRCRHHDPLVMVGTRSTASFIATSHPPGKRPPRTTAVSVSPTGRARLPDDVRRQEHERRGQIRAPLQTIVHPGHALPCDTQLVPEGRTPTR